MSQPVPPADGALAPLSFAQRAVWVRERLEAGTPVFHCLFALRLRGPVERTSLRRAWSAVVRRHEALRTVFAVHEAEPVQRVVPPGTAALAEHDLRDAPDPLAACDEAVAALARDPFDLERGPLFRLLVARVADEHHVLALCVHHLVFDGWSLQVLLDDLLHAYAAHCAGREPAWSPAPRFVDHVSRERRLAGDPAFGERLEAWCSRLRGLAPLTLGEAPARTADGSLAGARRVHRLDAAPWRAARDCARTARTTPFVLLLTALAATLGGHAHTDDVPVATFVAGRRGIEEEEAVGLFVRTLLMRADLSGDPPFEEALRRVRRTVLRGLASQDVPWEQIARRLGAGREAGRALGHAPLFDVRFQPPELPAQPARGAGTRARGAASLRRVRALPAVLRGQRGGRRPAACRSSSSARASRRASSSGSPAGGSTCSSEPWRNQGHA